MEVKQIQTLLNNNGFPCGTADGKAGPKTKIAVTNFQMAFNNGPWLTIDGVAGPATQAALGKLPHISENFVIDELESHGDRTCYVKRELLKGLEALRTALNMPIHIISAYRDPAHNKRVGGASSSMHLYGYAADVPGLCSYRKVAGLQIFSGIGQRNGAISHVDMRHLAGDRNLTPKASPTAPVIWSY